MTSMALMLWALLPFGLWVVASGAHLSIACSAAGPGDIGGRARSIGSTPIRRCERSSVESEATHGPTGQTFAVKANSRHRAGVLNHPGTPDPDHRLRADARAVRRLFMNAIDKAPADEPY